VTPRARASDPCALLVFRDGWEEQLDEVAAGDAPAESYGYFALSAAVPTLPRSTRRLCRPDRGAQSASPTSARTPSRDPGSATASTRRAQFDAAPPPIRRMVVATNDSIGLPLLALHARRRLSNPVVLMSIGLCDALARGAVHARLARRYVRLLGEARAILVLRRSSGRRSASSRLAPASP
jgi:hypothetical protein